MRKRDKAVVIRFTEEEYEAFKSNVDRTKLFAQSYLRMLLKGVRPTEKPDDEFWDFLRELGKIQNNLQQIAYKAWQLNFQNAGTYQKVADSYHRHCAKILMMVMNITEEED